MTHLKEELEDEIGELVDSDLLSFDVAVAVDAGAGGRAVVETHGEGALDGLCGCLDKCFPALAIPAHVDARELAEVSCQVGALVEGHG